MGVSLKTSGKAVLTRPHVIVGVNVVVGVLLFFWKMACCTGVLCWSVVEDFDIFFI